VRVILVDNSGHQGATAKMLEMAARRELGIVPDVIATTTFGQRIEASDTADSLVFISVTEQALSLRSNQMGNRRTACESLQIAQTLVHRDIRSKVILVAHRGDSHFTGIDAVAAMVAGIACIVDDRLLLTEGVLSSLHRHRHTNNRWRTLLAIGDTASRLRNVKDMFNEWDEDISTDGTQDAACFKTCLALAQLDKLRPLRGHGHKYSYVQLAHALNFAEPETSFRLSVGDLRKVLSIISNRLLVEEDDYSERIYLPSRVKEKLEFPRNLPVIEGIPEREMSQILYQACRSMETVDHISIGGHESLAIRLPIKEFRHLPKVKGK